MHLDPPTHYRQIADKRDKVNMDRPLNTSTFTHTVNKLFLFFVSIYQ